jgi:uncharacterized repeat protein (TIGR01451 family)
MRVIVRIALAAVMLVLLAAGPVAAGQLATADISVTKSGTPDPVQPGGAITYTITVQNAGPSTAFDVSLSDAIPTGTTFVSLTAPVGWTLTTPPVGGTGNVTGNIPTLTVAAGAQVFTLVVQVDAGATNGSVIDNIASVTSDEISDPNPINNSFITIVGVAVAPIPSVPDAAMASSAHTSPLMALGFAVLLFASLGTLAFANIRRR